MPDTIQIVSVAEESAAGPGNTMKPVLRITFKVGDHGPFIERVDKAGFNANSIKQTLQAFAQQLGLLTQK